MNTLNRIFSHLSLSTGLLLLTLLVPAVAEAQSSSSATMAVEVSEEKNLTLTAAERQRFVGTYLMSMSGQRSMPFRIYEEQEALYGQPQGGSAKQLVYLGNNTFHPEGEPESAMTFTVEGDKATRFSVASPQGTIEGAREGEDKR